MSDKNGRKKPNKDKKIKSNPNEKSKFNQDKKENIDIHKEKDYKDINSKDRYKDINQSKNLDLNTQNKLSQNKDDISRKQIKKSQEQTKKNIQEKKFQENKKAEELKKEEEFKKQEEIKQLEIRKKEDEARLAEENRKRQEIINKQQEIVNEYLESSDFTSFESGNLTTYKEIKGSKKEIDSKKYRPSSKQNRFKDRDGDGIEDWKDLDPNRIDIDSVDDYSKIDYNDQDRKERFNEKPYKNINLERKYLDISSKNYKNISGKNYNYRLNKGRKVYRKNPKIGRRQNNFINNSKSSSKANKFKDRDGDGIEDWKDLDPDKIYIDTPDDYEKIKHKDTERYIDSVDDSKIDTRKRYLEKRSPDKYSYSKKSNDTFLKERDNINFKEARDINTDKRKNKENLAKYKREYYKKYSKDEFNLKEGKDNLDNYKEEIAKHRSRSGLDSIMSNTNFRLLFNKSDAGKIAFYTFQGTDLTRKSSEYLNRKFKKTNKNLSLKNAQKNRKYKFKERAKDKFKPKTSEEKKSLKEFKNTKKLKESSNRVENFKLGLLHGLDYQITYNLATSDDSGQVVEWSRQASKSIYKLRSINNKKNSLDIDPKIKAKKTNNKSSKLKFKDYEKDNSIKTSKKLSKEKNLNNTKYSQKSSIKKKQLSKKTRATNKKKKQKVVNNKKNLEKKKAIQKKLAEDRLKKTAHKRRIDSILKKLKESIKKLAADALKALGSSVIALIGVGGLLIIILLAILNMGVSIEQTSYMADDTDLTEIVNIYTNLEAELEMSLVNTKEDNPGYDDYRIIKPNYGFDPHQLLSYLTVKYGKFKADDPKLLEAFKEMYSYEKEDINETYTAVVDGELKTLTKKILKVSAKNNGLDKLIDELSEKEKESFELIYEYLGQLAHYSSPIASEGVQDESIEQLAPGLKPTVPGGDIEIPENSGMNKTWMDYRTITNRSSKQWELQQMATDGEYGIRHYMGLPMVAVAEMFVNIGDVIEVNLSNGEVIKAVVGDVKAKEHVDANGIHKTDGSVVEFIVNENLKPAGNYQEIVPEWRAYVTSIKGGSGNALARGHVRVEGDWKKNGKERFGFYYDKEDKEIKFRDHMTIFTAKGEDILAPFRILQKDIDDPKLPANIEYDNEEEAIIITHKDGFKLYYYNTEFTHETGKSIKAGDPIGKALKKEMKIKLIDDRGNILNPYLYFWSETKSSDSIWNPKGVNNNPLGGAIFRGNTVYYSQHDPAYAGFRYDTGTISSHGCGPTSMAMAVSSLTGQSVSPAEMAQFSMARGHALGGDGTSWGLWPDAARHYGLNCTEFGNPRDLSEYEKWFKQGALVILSGYTRNGGPHIMLATGVIQAPDGSGYVLSLNDPNDANRVFLERGGNGFDGLRGAWAIYP